MKGEIENNLSRETWLLIVLLGTFVYYILTARYIYWYDMIYTSVALVITGALFLFLFNLADGKKAHFKLDSVIKVIAFLALIAIGAFVIVPVTILLFNTVWMLIGWVPTEIVLVIYTAVLLIAILLIVKGAKGLWEIAQTYTVHFQYETPAPDEPTPQ
jgi:hypothetical protein